MNYRTLCLSLLGMGLLVVGAIAWAKGGDKVQITGDTLDRPVEIADNSCILSAFSSPNLEDLTTKTDHPPADLGDSFLITRFTKLNDSSFLPFDRARYYLDPAGGLGYVNYLGMAENGPTAYDGQWFRPTAQTDAIIKSLLGQPIPGTPDQVIISSDSLPRALTITDDVCTLNALAAGNLDDPALRVNRPPTIEGSGYLITRYRGEQPYDQVRLYRDPRGGRAYVYDLGPVDGSASATAGQWFRPTLLSQSVMDGLLNPSGYAGQP